MSEHISKVLEPTGEGFIIIAGGTRYFIIREDVERVFRGHGGNAFLFKLNDTGKVVYSTNVWNTGKTDEADTAVIMQHEEWASVGISKFGALSQDADVYVNSDEHGKFSIMDLHGGEDDHKRNVTLREVRDHLLNHWEESDFEDSEEYNKLVDAVEQANISELDDRLGGIGFSLFYTEKDMDEFIIEWNKN